MKTIKNSISMKALLSFVFAIAFSVFANGQFLTPDPDAPVTQTPTEEVRTGSVVTYDLTTDHIAGEQYRWAVTGGSITEIDGTATGGVAVVDFTVDAHTITVDWNQAPATAIASVAGQIQVQKLNAGGCPSQVQTLPINVWNEATATITGGSEDFCSGGSPSTASISVALTGAPDGTVDGFAVDYGFSIPAGISALDGAGDPVNATGTVTTDNSSVNIALPATLINTTNGDLDFVVSLDRMNDDFAGNGTVSGTYTITVHPVPVTGDIQSTSSLTRN
jgi:hypothetical protein